MTENDAPEKDFDEPHRWEVEPHPWDSSYDLFVTDDDDAALQAILHAAEMHLWDDNDGEERTLRVKLNSSIPNVRNTRADLAAPDAAQFEVWWKGQIARDFVQSALIELEKTSGPKLIAGTEDMGIVATAMSVARRALDKALETLDNANKFATAPGPVRQARAETCVWSLDDTTDSSLWETDCGQAFQFTDEGPEENHFKFCYCCGKPLEVLRRTESDEVDAAAALRAQGEEK